MPILAYFCVVGTFLLGLLFAADAYLPATTPAIASSNFSGLPAKYTAANGPLITSSASAPEPDMNSPAVVAAAQPNPAPNLAPVNARSDATVQPPKAKRKAVARQRPNNRYDHRYDNYNSFAWSWQNDHRRWASGNGSWGSFR
jgi:hypothetical protein